MGFIGGIIGLSLAGTLFDNGLGTHIAAVPNIPPSVVAAVTQSIEAIPHLPEPLRSEVIAAALQAVRPTWLLVLGSVALASVCGA